LPTLGTFHRHTVTLRTKTDPCKLSFLICGSLYCATRGGRSCTSNARGENFFFFFTPGGTASPITSNAGDVPTKFVWPVFFGLLLGPFGFLFPISSPFTFFHLRYFMGSPAGTSLPPFFFYTPNIYLFFLFFVRLILLRFFLSRFLPLPVVDFLLTRPFGAFPGGEEYILSPMRWVNLWFAATLV